MILKKICGQKFLIGKTVSVQNLILKILKNDSAGAVILPASLNDLASISANKTLEKFYRQIDYCVTDGMPLVWYFSLLQFFNKKRVKIQRVYGPDLMKDILIRGKSETTHAFYGSSPQVLESLRNNILKFAPQTKIVTMISPPFRKINLHEEATYLISLCKLKPKVLWLGLSSPEQVMVAARWSRFLPETSIFCVGAAFDFLAGTKKQAPLIMQKYGLEWLFRLFSEPKRLWKRYLFSIPFYLLKKFIHFFQFDH